MRRAGLLALGALALALAAPAGAADEPTGDRARGADSTALEIAGRVQLFYDALTTYQADFVQSYHARAAGIERRARGRLAVARPGRISFRYLGNEPHRVLADGRRMRIYEADSRRLYETPLDRTQYPAALAFLLGQGRLSRDFTLRLLDAERLRVQGGFVLEGVPRDASPAYARVLFYVDAATSHVRRVLVLDALGNRNRFDFHNARVNEPLPTLDSSCALFARNSALSGQHSAVSPQTRGWPRMMTTASRRASASSSRSPSTAACSCGSRPRPRRPTRPISPSAERAAHLPLGRAP
jgi:outer membrane lipoprotein carrier protein